MTVGIARLAIRSSPTQRSLLGTIAQAHVHTQPPLHLDVMFAKANKDFEANQNARRNQLSKQLFPSSSPSAPNADIRTQLKRPGSSSASARIHAFANPLDKRSANVTRPNATRPGPGPGRGSIASLYANSNSFKTDLVDLTESEPPKEAVFFAEDEFSDDDNLDLDFEAPTALPILASKPVPVNIDSMPPPQSTQSEKIPWSSSPPSHFLPSRTISDTSTTTERSLKRESSGDQNSWAAPIQKKAKRRVLPQSYRQPVEEEEEEEDAVFQTPARKSKAPMWDATASTLQEQKMKHRTQRLEKEAGPTLDCTPDEVEEIVNKTKAKASFAVSLSNEQKQVLNLVVNKKASVFFTGAAGTGKSVLMRSIIDALHKKHKKTPDAVAVTASTGLAACNIGGITLHSFSGIGLGKDDAPALIKKIRRNPKAKNRWLKTKILIIDEISMVDGELFDKLDKIGRNIRNNGRPWGGIQLVITGDFFQLPPVPEYGKRDTKFAFDAATWSTSIDHTIGLSQVFRQRDPQFANMLNEMRLGRISEDTVRAFKALSRPLQFDDGLGMAELFSTRNEVESSNERRLRELPGSACRFDALDTGHESVRDKLLANMMAPKAISLKLDTQVMLIKNLDETLVNGSLGKVIAFSDEKTFDMNMGSGYGSDGEEDALAKARRKLSGYVNGQSDGGSGRKFPVVQFRATNGTPRTILCQPEEWKVELPSGEVQATRTQLPLILAWALSIHKAQGQTLERVKVNLGRVFERGQAYVALSRATTQAGLQVLGFDKAKVMAHPRVVTFYNQLYSAAQANSSVSDLLTNRIGSRPPAPKLFAPPAPPAPPAPAKQTRPTVIDVDADEEEAMASYGYY